jgi:hypothetical protein
MKHGPIRQERPGIARPDPVAGPGVAIKAFSVLAFYVLAIVGGIVGGIWLHGVMVG